MSEKVPTQKLRYIHENPVRAKVYVNILRNINIRRPNFTKQELIIGDSLRIIVIKLISVVGMPGQAQATNQQRRKKIPVLLSTIRCSVAVDISNHTLVKKIWNNSIPVIYLAPTIGHQ